MNANNLTDQKKILKRNAADFWQQKWHTCLVLSLLRFPLFLRSFFKSFSFQTKLDEWKKHLGNTQDKSPSETESGGDSSKQVPQQSPAVPRKSPTVTGKKQRTTNPAGSSNVKASSTPGPQAHSDSSGKSSAVAVPKKSKTQDTSHPKTEKNKEAVEKKATDTVGRKRTEREMTKTSDLGRDEGAEDNLPVIAKDKPPGKKKRSHLDKGLILEESREKSTKDGEKGAGESGFKRPVSNKAPDKNNKGLEQLETPDVSDAASRPQKPVVTKSPNSASEGVAHTAQQAKKGPKTGMSSSSVKPSPGFGKDVATKIRPDSGSGMDQTVSVVKEKGNGKASTLETNKENGATKQPTTTTALSKGQDSRATKQPAMPAPIKATPAPSKDSRATQQPATPAPIKATPAPNKDQDSSNASAPAEKTTPRARSETSFSSVDEDGSFVVVDSWEETESAARDDEDQRNVKEKETKHQESSRPDRNRDEEKTNKLDEDQTNKRREETQRGDSSDSERSNNNTRGRSTERNTNTTRRDRRDGSRTRRGQAQRETTDGPRSSQNGQYRFALSDQQFLPQFMEWVDLLCDQNKVSRQHPGRNRFLVVPCSRLFAQTQENCCNPPPPCQSAGGGGSCGLTKRICCFLL